jgi:DNA-binding CsgD family transcriptional regulator
MLFFKDWPVPEDRSGFFRRVLLLALILTSGWLLVYSIFPLFEQAFPVTRDISTAVQGVLFVLLAMIAMRRPTVLRFEPFSVLAIALTVGGTALAPIGIEQASPPLMVLSATMQRIGMCWFQIIVGMTLLSLSSRAMGLCIVLGFVLSYAIQYVIFLLPSLVGVWVFAAIPFLCYLLALPFVKDLFEGFKIAEPPSESAIIHPNSFLPFSHQLFICIFVFRIISGYALSFGEIQGTPPLTFLIPVAVVLAVLLLFFKWQLQTDRLFQVSVLLIIGGLLLVPLTGIVTVQPVVSTILSSGVGCLDVLFWLLLVATAARNVNGAVPVFAWGSGVSCFGLIIGAYLGRLTNAFAFNNPTSTILITAALIWTFVLYVYIVLKGFSFEQTFKGIVPDKGTASISIDYKYLDKISENLAKRFALTPREVEVLKLLARGRSSRYIQTSLVISHNTVKAHVKHIYQKAHVHTNQELLDLLEKEALL